MKARYNQMLDIMTDQMNIVSQAQIQETVQKITSRTPADKAVFTTIMERYIKNSVVRTRDGIKKEMPFAELVDQV